MSMSVVYATVSGRLVQENRGGSITRYVADTLGSVIQSRDAAGNQTSSTTYWPFGEVRTSSGTNPSPWGFCGIWGYYKDAIVRLYVRMRNLRADLSRWLTVDTLWPGESAYGYADNDPVLLADPSGKCTQHSGKDILDCLAKDKNGYNCIPGNGCPQPGKKIDTALALCVFYYECGLCDSGCSRDNGGGMGQLTKGAIHDLIASGCNKCVTKKSDTTGDDWCAGAQASYMWMQCRGLEYPGGYGDSTYGPPHNGLDKIKKCADCVRKGGAIENCGKKFIR